MTVRPERNLLTAFGARSLITRREPAYTVAFRRDTFFHERGDIFKVIDLDPSIGTRYRLHFNKERLFGEPYNTVEIEFPSRLKLGIPDDGNSPMYVADQEKHRRPVSNPRYFQNLLLWLSTQISLNVSTRVGTRSTDLSENDRGLLETIMNIINTRLSSE